MFVKSKYLIIIILLGISVSGCTSDDGSSSVKLTNPIQDCRMVKVPYEVQESYTVQEPYTAYEDIEVPLKYDTIERIKSTTLKGLDVWAYGEVTVRNVDSETGSFRVLQTFSALNKPDKSKATTK